MRTHNQSRLYQQGVGLIEVLVALLLLAVAVLGFSMLQIKAVGTTDESLTRTRAMSIMRSFSESMRQNITQKAGYVAAINAGLDSAGTGINGVSGITVTSCKPTGTPSACSALQKAQVDALNILLSARNNGINLGIVDCPGTAAIATNAFLNRQCIIASWGESIAAIGTAANNCANTDAVYNTNATCVIMESY